MILPEYKYQNSGLQITCPIIVLTQIIDDLKNEVEKLELTSENCYLDKLNKVLSSLKRRFNQRRVILRGEQFMFNMNVFIKGFERTTIKLC